ncbi:MAG: TLD domain-containing protein, partial [Terracidiphilus sp.]|nr:TLD domain-containing protein [Terracidiphilus sp.]
DGLVSFVSGVDVCVRVAAMDVAGEVVESIEAGDVSVCVEGAVVRSVSVCEPGRVEVVYAVCGDRVDPITLSLSVCGSVMPGSPWTVCAVLGDSVILRHVPGETRSAFVHTLTGEWLPRGRLVGPLLYRGSRDGMTPESFHRLCDGQGPTLVLVRSDNGFSFGGYAGESWESPDEDSENEGDAVYCDTAFLFSVVGPYANVVRFPAKTGKYAIWKHRELGPCFENGLLLESYIDGGPFGNASRCSLGLTWAAYEDTLKKGRASLTGAVDGKFIPQELEVYKVAVTE